MLAPTREHAHEPLQRIMLLNAEQQSIYRAALYRAVGLTIAEQNRLDQIACEIALAHDECNRMDGRVSVLGGTYL